MVAPSTLWRLLIAMGSAFKTTAHAAGQQRPDVWQRRPAWLEAQPALEPARRVCIDQTGASTKPSGVVASPAGPRRNGQALRPGRQGRTFLPGSRSSWPLEDNDVRRGSPARPDDSAHGPRRAAARRRLPGLGRAGSRTDPAAGRHRRSRQSARTQTRRRPSGERSQRCNGASCRPISRTSTRSLQGTRPGNRGGEIAYAEREAWPQKSAARTGDDLWKTIGTAIALFTPGEC